MKKASVVVEDMRLYTRERCKNFFFGSKKLPIFEVLSQKPDCSRSSK
jgi:hypothetical protein